MILKTSNYNSKTRSCDLVKFPNEGKTCANTVQCNDWSLNCDVTTKKCTRELFNTCFQDADCLTGFVCANQLCVCVSGKR